jgi:general secretion pathway protein D
MPSRAMRQSIGIHAGIVLLVPLVSLLAGCAGQLAYYEGKSLVADGKAEAGLVKLQEAVAASPRDVQYRSTYLRARDHAISDLLEQADKLAAQSDPGADAAYRRVLTIEPANDRALAGLRRIDMVKRHVQLRNEADTALHKGDFETARRKLAVIIAENPDDERTRALQRSLTEKTAGTPAETLLVASYTKPISIEFKDAALKQIFDVIARSSGLNFLFDKDVRTDQRTSIFLRNSTIESAIDFMLRTNQLEQQVVDASTILIYPNQAPKQKEYQELVVRSFYLANAEAKTVANTLKTLLKANDVVIDDKLNMLIMRASPDAIRLAEKLIAMQDVAEPEVMLEVEILEIKRSRLQDLGIQWPASIGLTPLPLGTQSGSTTGVLTLRDLRQQNSGTLAASVGPVTARANLQDGDVNILANPRIRTRNHENAKVYIGERVPNVTTTATATGFVSESINYVDVGLKLDAQPTVYLENDVAIKISLEVSSIVDQIKTQSGTTAYRIGTRTASTVLRLKDGETQVLAGLINDEDRHTGNRIPGVGEVPILGRLFGNVTDDTQKTEIVLSITPRLIRNIQRPDAEVSQFRSGTETSLRLRPDSRGTAPASAAGAAAPNAKPEQASNAAPTGTSASSGVGMPASGVQLRWLGPAQVRVGETVALALLMQPDQPVSAVPLQLGYDSKVLQVVNVTEGGFLNQEKASTTFNTQVHAESGQIDVSAVRSGGSGASVPGVVMTMTFKALAPAEGTLVQLISAVPVNVEKKALGTQPLAPFALRVLP